MDVKQLLRTTDDVYGGVLRNFGVALKDPAQRRAGARIIGSWITGGADSIGSVMGGAGLRLDHENLVDEFALDADDPIWMVFEGTQYPDDSFHRDHMRPVFEASGLAELFDCCVDCIRRLHATNGAPEYDAGRDVHVGASKLPPVKALAVTNRVRAIADLPPALACRPYEVLTYNPVVLRHVVRMWRARMLWRRLREYLQCLNRTRSDAMGQAQDVIGTNVVDMLGIARS